MIIQVMMVRRRWRMRKLWLLEQFRVPLEIRRMMSKGKKNP
jgi:hypothetical protein